MSGIESRVHLTHHDFVMQNHRLHGVSVMPGVVFFDLVYRAVVAAGWDHRRICVRDTVLAEAIVTTEGYDREIVLTIDGEGVHGRPFQVRSRWLRDGEPVSGWRDNAHGLVCRTDDPLPPPVDLAVLRATARREDLATLYARAAREQIRHGPAMTCSGTLHVGDGHLVAELTRTVVDPAQDAGFHLHPASLDASTLAGFGQVGMPTDDPFVPMFVRELRAPEPLPATCYVHVASPERLAPSGDVVTTDYTVRDADGRFLAGFTGLTCKRIREPGLIHRLLDDLPSAVAGLTTALREAVAGMLHRPAGEVPTGVGFYDLGLDSVTLLRLTGRVEELVGRTLYPTLLFEHSTIDALASHLAETGTPPPSRPDTAVTLVDVWEETDLPEPSPVEPVVVAEVAPPGSTGPRVATPDALRTLPSPPSAVVVVSDRPAEDLWRAAAALVDVGPCDLVVVTTGEPTPERAATGALARTITAEVPALRCRFLHVPDPAEVAVAVRRELGVAEVEPEVRYVAGRRRVRRWREVDLTGAVDPWRQGGVYLVTGGSGGLADRLVRHLTTRYAATVALVSRTRPADDLVGAGERAGGLVYPVLADVTDPVAVRRAVAEVRDRFGRIDGVLHCAGVTRDGVFFRGDPADLATTTAPKLAGLRHLDEATAADDLDFLVVFSSASAVVANPGQGAYGYANATLAEAGRRGRGRTVVVDWPLWADGGMAVTPEVVRRSGAATGQTPLPTDVGLDLLRRALGAGHHRILVLHGDPTRIRALVPAASPTAASPTTVPSAAPPGSVPTPPEAPPTHAASIPAASTGVTSDGPVAAGAVEGSADPDAVAVVGLAGRYPGAADVAEFWQVLADGRDAVTEVPADRWDHSEVFDPVKGTPGRTYARWGGFLTGVDRFAPAFFGVSRRDAERMDPQERLFLTTSWHALQDAGHPPESLGGETVGVYVGVMWNHYQLVGGAPDGVAPTAMHCAVANRVSHTFDLTGPSLAVDTACSSSLTAVHLAVAAIRRGECTMAVAGGVNVTVHPQKYLQLAQGQWLSTDGRCRAFGRDGTGYTPGEGVGAVVLKPLSRAVADGDHVYGVIRATSVNHTGRTAGATVPSPQSQAALIRRALADARWDPATLGYVEAHGTGTALGDPIEVEGLRQAFQGGVVPTGSCAIGSVKSNIGHLEGAAGVAGLTKVLLQMRHRHLVASLHADELNPHIDFDDAPVRVQRVGEPWTVPEGGTRRAGVSAFGAGGTNAHVLVEEFVPAPRTVPTGPALVVLSARTASDLRRYAAVVAAGLPNGTTAVQAVADRLGVPASALDPGSTLGDLGLTAADLVGLVGVDGLADLTDRTRLDAIEVDSGVADIAFTTQVGRTPMPVRLAVVAGTVAELRAALHGYAETGQGGRTVVLDGVPGAEDPVDLFKAGRLADLARHWVGGGEVDWLRCHGDPRPHRVSLPGYPLPEERCWIGAWEPAAAGPLPPQPAVPAGPQPAVPAGPQPAASVVPETGPSVGTYAGPPVGTRGGPEAVAAGADLDVRFLDHGVALLVMRATMFTAGLLDGLRSAFDEIERRDDVRAVVVTGEGPVFSMGGTPEALRTLAEGEGTFTDASFVYEGLLRCTRPVVTAVSGHASGGGLAFACYGDIVLLGEESVYSANFTSYGFTPGMGATYVLEQRFGPTLAAEMLLTGRSITGAELHRRGATVTVLPRAEVLRAALDLARAMAEKPVDPVRTLKTELAGRILRRLPDVIDSEVRMHERVLGAESADRVRDHFARVTAYRNTVDPAAQRPVPPPVPEASVTGTREPTDSRETADSREPAEARGAVEVRDVADTRDVAEVRAAVEEFLSALLYLRPGEITAERSFSDLGLDSIGAVELVRDLNRRFGTDLDSVTVYDHPTVTDLADAVLRATARSAALRDQAAAPTPATTPAPAPVTVAVPAAAPATGAVPAAAPDPTPVTVVVPTAPAPTEPPPLTLTVGPVPSADGRVDPRPAAPAAVPVTPVRVDLDPPDSGSPARRPSDSGSPARRPSDSGRAAPDEPAGVPEPPVPIAVIGMSGRFPDAPDLVAFWANLAAGHCAIREVPADRWDLTDRYDPDPAALGTTRSRWAALLDDVDAFDAGLFRISPRDAEAMDPQQRLFLEQAWAALEDAGHAGRPLRCGVFVGCAAGDYAEVLDRAGQGDTSEAFLGTSPSILPARIAYLLDLTGPTMAVDTACSSSLTAVHLACESIRTGECDTAVAGGVAVMCTPRMQVWTSQTGMLSPTGRSAPFDSAADGITLGEGVGAVVLKRLDRALADGDHVHGVLLAGGINGDGRTNGITAPSAGSQAALLREVHARAGVPVSYVETHGTGTALGDPIEVKALVGVLGPDCAIGSVKANIGHTTMAAGIAGLLKVLLCLRHRQLPPTPVTDPIDGPPVVRTLTPWVGERLVAGVSSFGFSGTNCHLVVAEAPVRAPLPAPQPATGHVVVPVSARTAAALTEQVDRLARHLDSTAVDVRDVAATLTRGRTHHPVRAAFVAADRDDLVRRLRGGPPPADTPADLVAAADGWVAGGAPDRLPPVTGRLVPLPGYPFARDRYWAGREEREITVDPATPFVADHRLDGRQVLPGAAFLHLALGVGSSPVGGVRWLRPVVVDTPTTLVLTAADRITLTAPDGTVHAEGRRRPAVPVPADVDLATVEARCPHRRPADDLYAAFDRAGLRYGPTFRVLTEVRVGVDEALGTLSARPGDDVQILDGAMQTLVGLVRPDSRPRVPFAVESAVRTGPLPAAARVHVTRRDEHRFDVLLTDEAGSVRARLDGVTLRPGPGTEVTRYAPTWRAAPAPTGVRPSGRVAVLHTPAATALAAALNPDVALPLGELPSGPVDTVHVLAVPDDPDGPPERDRSTLDAFRLVRHLIGQGAHRRPLTLTFVVAYVVGIADEPVRPHAAGLVGLAGAVAAEYPQWAVTCVDVGDGDPVTLAEAIRREDGTDRLVAVRGARRLVRTLTPATGTSAAVPLRDDGVYLLVGGAGGLGVEVSRHLARTRRARLAWIGRSAEDDRIRDRAAEVEASGGRVAYLSADVTDPVALRRAVAEVRARFGRIHGVLHTAIVLDDRPLSRLDDEAFLAVARPKVAGLAALAAAVRDEPLDFLALFSSALSYAPAPGQANYAAASTFEDAYGLHLHRSGLPVRVVNWGYWGSVGVVAGADYTARFRALGIDSIEPDEGVRALEQVLAAPDRQVAVLRGTPAGLALLGVVPSAPSVTTPGPVSVPDAVAAPGPVSDAVAAPGPVPGGAAPGEDDLARSRAGFRALDGLARDLLRGLDLPVTPAGTGPSARLRAAVDAATATAPTGLTAEAVLAVHPDLAPHVELLRRCVTALPGVLAGTVAPVEALFPAGSTDLVAAVYRGQAVADFHHRLLADQVTRAVRGVTGRAPRVLEIGAGTGSATTFALPAAAGARYHYTDVSTAFLREGEQRFGSRHPELEFALLDIERDPVAQGFPAGGYDVVLATNVLHATGDVVGSLRHVRTLLRPGGVLLANEVTRHSDFLTATFGLLPGWWGYTDPTRRLPHSPLLTPARWRAALAEAGFTCTVLGVPGTAEDAQEQGVLVATAGPSAPSGSPSPQAVRAYVTDVFAEVLKFRPADLDEQVTFDNFGVDSLVGQRIVHRFETDLGELPATLLFEHLTIAQLADHLRATRPAALAARLAGETLPTAVVPLPPTTPDPFRSAPTVPDPSPTPSEVSAPTVPDPSPTPSGVSAVRRDGDRPEPIAVVGVTGRYPGAATVEDFWHNLVRGTTSVTEVPADRWDWRTHFDPRRGRPGHSYGRWGGFLADVDAFDPAFFGILPRDAAAVDPQERLFLETVWHLLEGAGYLGSRHVRETGVFVGTMYGSYGRIAAAQGWPAGRYTDGHSAYWSVANRVSHVLDLTGPSFAVDSACSASLTAVHLACESLRRGECAMAVAGGVNLVLHPAHLIALSSMTMLADDGTCKVFDARADGFAPGEGVGAVLLKPLSAAERDGDRIWGVVEGGFVNAGGRTAGYTVPNPNAQADLVAEALRRAGVRPGDIGYVEAHGTGTALGDPIEIAGLTRALGTTGRYAVGSVKANIGHLEGAAGIAGLTKVLLQIANGVIAPCANLDTVNPKIDLPDSVTLPTEAVPWSSPRRAGISSFGAGGANAHLVVAEHPRSPEPPMDPAGPHAVLLSARTEPQLRALATALADLVEQRSPALHRLAYTSQVGRAELPHRLAVVVSDPAELVRRLRTGEVHTGVVVGDDPRRDLFTGPDGTDLVTDLLDRRLLDRIAAIWVLGVPVDWARLWPARPHRVAMPPYPFDRQRHWLPDPTGSDRAAGDPCVYLRPRWQDAPASEAGAAPRRVLVVGSGPTFGGTPDEPSPDLVVIHLPAAPGALADEVRAALHDLLRVTRPLLARPGTPLLRVVVTTPDTRPAYVAVAAALRTLALEHSRFSGALVLGEPTVADLRHVTGEPEGRVSEIRYVDGVRQVRRMVPFDPPPPPPTPTGGVYVVVGGTGAVGGHLARHLLSTREPRAVVLVGRTAPTEPVDFVAADLTDGADVRRAVGEIRGRYGRIDVLVHAAGIHRDARAVTKSTDDVDRVVAPKVFGLHHLTAALDDDPPEQVVLCSSVAGRTGNLGQVDYAYANAFLDESATGRPGTVSVCWPLWADGGMTVDDATRRQFARRWGSAPLATVDALRAFDRTVAAAEPVVAVVRPVEAPGAGAGAGAGAGTGTGTGAEVGVGVGAGADGAAPSPVGPDLDAELRVLAAGFLLVEPDEVEPDTALLDLGFDSISLTELVDGVNERFGLDLLPTVLYECPTLTAFADHLRTVVTPTEEPPAAAAPVVAAPPAPAPAAAAPVTVAPPVASPPFVASPSVLPTVAEVVADDAVAVVGMAGVFPGSPDLETFWAHLTAGDDLVRAVPSDRTDLLAHPATAGVRAGFLDDVRTFDAARFGISPREATLMDPQQRIFLHTVWQAVVDAGYRPADLAGSETGLFVGVSACDYDDLLRDHGVPVEAHTASGLADCILANRASYVFDLRGPSEAIDTACSSSLVAVHRAVGALRSGECSMALAGGVNVLLSPGLFVAFGDSGMLSPDGRCKTFDAAADGYGRGEGCGVVVLKPLRAALADGDQVIGVIRGSAVNHAGRGPSLTAPNPQAQAQVVARAYRAAGVDPSQVSYVETHGTGTRLGDPIEIEGLKKVFAGVETPISLGAVKTNIGHLEAAAGIAGLIKVLLGLRYGELPPTLHQREPNPYLRLAGTPFTVLDRRLPWTGHRVAGVSSFGFGGTNAHVVVASPPPVAPTPDRGPWRLVLSADSAPALTTYRRRVAEILAEGRDLDRVAFTLQTGREPGGHRFAAVVDGAAEAVAVLLDGVSPRLDDPTRAWLDGVDVDWAGTWDHVPARISVPAPPLGGRQYWFDGLVPAPSAATTPAPAQPTAPPVETPTAPIRNGRIVLRDPAALRRPPTEPASPPAEPPPVALPATPAVPAPVVPVVAPGGGSDGTEVADRVRECVARVLGTEAADITADTAFSDLGLDSIFRMELARLVMATFPVDLTAADLYEHDTVDALAAFLTRAGARVTPPALTPPVETPPDPTPPVQTPPVASSGPVAGKPVTTPTVTETVTEVLGQPVRPGTTFTEAGLTSFDMLRVVAALEQRYGALPKTLLFDQPTLADLDRFLADREVHDRRPGATTPTVETPEEVDGEPVVVRKRTLVDRPALRAVVEDLDRRYAKEGGLAGRDIAPYAFVDASRQGYVNFSVRGTDLFAWSFVGAVDHFRELVAQWVAWARRSGLHPNFLSLEHLTEVAGEPVTATPFGAVQRLPDLSTFTTAGGRMQRLRHLLRRFERAGACRTEEYTIGADPETDRRIAEMMDSWGRGKQMVNPYVGVVRAEVLAGTLDPRHRVFLTRVDEEPVNTIIVTRIPSENGYLLDLEFYPDTMPTGGVEYAIVRIIEQTMAEGCTSFSFGASFGVAITESPNADPAVAAAIEELHSVGVFGPGNFQFKNKFRPVNVPIYLCQPAAGDRTSVTDVILMIADPDLTGPAAAATPSPTDAEPLSTPPPVAARPRPTPPPTAPGPRPTPAAAGPRTAPTTSSRPDPTTVAGRTAILAAHGHNPLTVPDGLVPVDLVTDSWAERADPAVEARMRDLADRTDPPPLSGSDWLPFAEVVPTPSGRAAEALLCRCRPGRRGVVVHTSVFPTWMLAFTDVGFEPVSVGDGRRLDPAEVAAALDDRTSFVVVEAANNAGGGRPVGLDELREVRRITRARGVGLVLDASRILDNALLLTAGDDPWPVVREMLDLVDTATLSLTKDFGVTAGGLLATNDRELAARLRDDLARRGAQVDRATRTRMAAALADREWVTGAVGRRMAAVRSLGEGLRERGVPVVEPVGGHCVLLDVARMPGFTTQDHPVMSCLAWLYAGVGIRGAPHLAVGELATAVRLAVPVGYGPADVAGLADRIADLAARPGPVTELVTGGVRSPGEAARAVYQPVDRVPDDVREALRERRRPADGNADVLREHQPDVRREVVVVDGGEVEVFTAGQGPTLLLLHPFNIGAGVFAHQFAELSASYRVVSVHHPGVGATTAVTDLGLTGLATLAREALHHLGITTPVHVAGASFGGLVALTWALTFPTETASLVLLGSSYKIGNRVGEINRLAVVAAEDLDRTIAGSGSSRLAGERAAAEALLLRCESMDPQTGLRYLDVFAERPDLADALAQITVPTLIVQGRHDTVIPAKTAHLLHGLIPGARYAELDDAGHFPYLTSPTACNELLSEFLATVPTDRAVTA
ncbi:SDR family NAD(P)-dependent oxidoreductase [Micromonospora sp. SH-82]|uniref:SDR family NAD(P)-dependent oxidoreductase n=1 Tax=Micromonospora sp. SH-82 TaxID=3132938 RepID=UPI003EBCAA97